MRILNGRPIVGGNVVEIAPHYDPTSNTAHVGAAMLFEQCLRPIPGWDIEAAGFI